MVVFFSFWHSTTVGGDLWRNGGGWCSGWSIWNELSLRGCCVLFSFYWNLILSPHLKCGLGQLTLGPHHFSVLHPCWAIHLPLTHHINVNGLRLWALRLSSCSHHISILKPRVLVFFQYFLLSFFVIFISTYFFVIFQILFGHRKIMK